MHLCGRLNYILRYNVRPFHDGCIRTQEVSSLHFTSLRFNSIQSAVVLTWILFILTIISTRVLASFHSYTTDIIQQQAELKGEKEKAGGDARRNSSNKKILPNFTPEFLLFRSNRRTEIQALDLRFDAF